MKKYEVAVPVNTWKIYEVRAKNKREAQRLLQNSLKDLIPQPLQFIARIASSTLLYAVVPHY